MSYLNVCSFVFSGFPRNVFRSQQPCCLSDTCNFISERVHELYLVKSARASPFSQWKERNRTLDLKKKKVLVSQGSVSGIMPAYCALKWKWTFIEWLTSWTMSSLSHNEEIVGGTDMVWKLCDKEECPKFKLLLELLFVLCENGQICWKTTKNFEWVSIRVSTELCICLCGMN